MKTRLIAVFAGLTTILGTATGALAGESGIAGSAAFSISGGNVTGVAVSAAVGKQDASAFAHQSGTQNVAGALGSDGVITQTIGTTGLVTSQAGAAGTLATNANTFSTGLGIISIGTASGDAIFKGTP